MKYPCGGGAVDFLNNASDLISRVQLRPYDPLPKGRRFLYSAAPTCLIMVNLPLTTLKMTMGFSTDPSFFKVILPP